MARGRTQRQKRSYRYNTRRIKLITILGGIGILGVTVFCVLLLLFSEKVSPFHPKDFYHISKGTRLSGNYPQDLELKVDLLTPNPYSRPGDPMEEVNGVVVHYTANPGTDAKANRNYFENLKTTHTTKASSHFVIGLRGDIVQCIPTQEISYASNDRNGDTISIEVCHPDETGKFKEESYTALVELVAWIVCEHHLNSDEILRHYDITGKNCPKYYVEHKEAWKQFKQDVFRYIEEHKER